MVSIGDLIRAYYIPQIYNYVKMNPTVIYNYDEPIQKLIKILGYFSG